MTKVEEYRRNAAETMRLAHRAATTEDKGRLMKLAEAWLDLADRMLEFARGARSSQREHSALPNEPERRADDL